VGVYRNAGSSTILLSRQLYCSVNLWCWDIPLTAVKLKTMTKNTQYTLSDFGYISTKLTVTHQATIFNVTSVSALNHDGYICCYSVVCASSNKVCQEFYIEFSYFWSLPNFSCVGSLPVSCLSTADTYMQAESCPEGSVFYMLLSQKMSLLLMRTFFFSVSDCSNVTNNNYYNLKHFKHFKLSFIKYTCVSW
jgi:hypothetical protein